MNQQPPNGQEPNEEPGQQFRSPLRLWALPPQQKRTLWQRYRLASWKMRIGIGCGLFLVICLLFSCVATLIRIENKPLPSTSIPGPGKVATFPSHADSTPTNHSFLPADIAVDFSHRQNHVHAIASDLLGLNGFAKISNNGQVVDYVSSAHINLVRVSVDMVDTFSTETSVNPQQQNWTRFDQVMTIIQTRSLQPILLISYSPQWLQPSANLCGGGDPSHVMPTYIVNGQNLGPQKWGALAAQVVAHMDHRFPGVHPAYEIWNEPDGTTFMCVAGSDPNPDLTRLNNYRAIYATAALQMKQQAQQDHMTIHVGGPGLAYPQGHASTWLGALLNDPAIAPYVDFISYHQYLLAARGSRDTWGGIVAAMQENSSLQGSSTGFAAEFEYISSLVRGGKQPDPQATPIYIDEYSINSAGTDCCRNDRTYGSLWHTLLIADLLNTVNDSRSTFRPAQNLVAGLGYFSAIEPPPSGQFCMFGTWDTAMDCGITGGIAPYPTYYAFQLLGAPSYLDITNNGFVTGAAAVKPVGLVVSGFFTNTKDNVLIVNPNATGYTQLTLGIRNPGLVQANPTFYILNQANPQISAQRIALTTTPNEYIAKISVPAYSIVALSLTGIYGTVSTIPTSSKQQRYVIQPVDQLFPRDTRHIFGVE